MFRDVMPLYASIPLCAGTVFIVSVAALVRHRTESYIKALGDLLGFKNFLEVAEKEKLEMLLEENPQYYYDILPYANVLGVSDKWENKFKDLTVQPPEYVVGRPDIWDLYVYSSIMRSVDRNMCAAMSPKPSSSSKSGFGGFGGHGGGGFRRRRLRRRRRRSKITFAVAKAVRLKKIAKNAIFLYNDTGE